MIELESKGTRTVGEEFSEYRAQRRAIAEARKLARRLSHINHCGRKLEPGPAGDYCPRCGKVFP